VKSHIKRKMKTQRRTNRTFIKGLTMFFLCSNQPRLKTAQDLRPIINRRNASAGVKGIFGSTPSESPPKQKNCWQQIIDIETQKKASPYFALAENP